MTGEPIELEQTEQGVVLPVKAKPGSSRDAVQVWRNGMLQVSVTQVAEKGKANQRLREVIAKELKLKKSQVELRSGLTSSEKRFLVSGVTADELVARIRGLS